MEVTQIFKATFIILAATPSIYGKSLEIAGRISIGNLGRFGGSRKLP